MTSSSDCSLAVPSPKMLPPFGCRRVVSFDAIAGRGFGAPKIPEGAPELGLTIAGWLGAAVSLRRVDGAGRDDERFGRELGRLPGGSVFGPGDFEDCAVDEEAAADSEALAAAETFADSGACESSDERSGMDGIACTRNWGR